MFGGLRLTAIVGGLGIAGMLFLYVALNMERGAHAKTKQLLADEKTAIADLRSVYATAAADQAQHAADEIAKVQLELNEYIENSKTLRRELSDIETKRDTEKRDADARIARLKRDNEELRRWAVDIVPGDWISFMRSPFGDTPGPATTAGGP